MQTSYTEILTVSSCGNQLWEPEQEWVNPFLANVPILYSLKTLEKEMYSGVFRRYKIGTLARNELNFYNF